MGKPTKIGIVILLLIGLAACFYLTISCVAETNYAQGWEQGWGAGLDTGYGWGYAEAIIIAQDWEAKALEYQAIAERKANPRQFNSLGELHRWLAEDNTDSFLYIPTKFDCENFAERLAKNALADGYLLAIYICEWDDGLHARNCAYINNGLWIIEPQDDNVWLLCNLD